VPGVGTLKQIPIKEHSVTNVLGDPKPGNGTMPGEPFYLIGRQGYCKSRRGDSEGP